MHKSLIRLTIAAVLLFYFNLSEATAQDKTLLSMYSTLTADTTAATANMVKIVAIFNFKPQYTIKKLASTNQIILQCNKLDRVLNLQESDMASGLISGIKSKNTLDSTQFNIEFQTNFTVKNTVLQELAAGMWQLAIDIELQNIKLPYLQKITQHSINKSIIKSIIDPQDSLTHQPFTVVVDPGHGGIDSGAVASDGVMEKHLTLQFAKVLQNILGYNRKIRVFLTRDTDKYLYLSERVQKARKLKADLFISIHADIINSPKIRGATIYSLSQTSSDQLAQQLELSQNKVDEIGGTTMPATLKTDNILLDLATKETAAFRAHIVDALVASMKQDNIKLINRPNRSANFYVLKALEFPSILIELGYLSNKSDEALIKNNKWQIRMAHSIAKAIEKFHKYRLANS